VFDIEILVLVFVVHLDLVEKVFLTVFAELEVGGLEVFFVAGLVFVDTDILEGGAFLVV